MKLVFTLYSLLLIGLLLGYKSVPDLNYLIHPYETGYKDAVKDYVNWEEHHCFKLKGIEKTFNLKGYYKMSMVCYYAY